MREIKKLLCVVIGAVILLSVTACGTSEIKVKISDMQTDTNVSVASGKTVSDILNDANIKLGDKDTVSPEKDTTVTKPTTIKISRFANAEVIYDGKTKKVSVVGGTVSDALDKAGVKLRKNDSVTPEKTAFVTDGMKITVARKLNVKLKVDGKTKDCLTEAKTVKDFLEEQNVKLSKKDKVTPALSKKIKNKTKVVVKRVTTKKVKKTETINYQTKYVKSASMKAGTSKVTQNGVNGTKKVTYKVTYIDGKEKSRKKVSEKIIKNPVNKVITQGSAAPASNNSAASGGKKEVSRKKFMDCDGSGHGYYEITYSDGSKKYEDF